MDKPNYHKLFAAGAYGTRVYEIWSEGATIHIIANGGHYTEEVDGGKAGRSLEQQVELRVNARIRGKMDHGFVDHPSKIGDTPTNQLGFHLPMLAQRMDRQRNFSDFDVFIQPKLDGHRCLTNRETSYSRGGKVIDTIGNLTSSIDIPDGVTIDGELYLHGQSLQTISSWAKRYQKDTERLEYHVYDLIVEDEPKMPFMQRYQLLQQLIGEMERVKLVPTEKVTTLEAYEYFRRFRNEGFEGAIVRTTRSLYEIGKRSKGLLKIKHYEDEEFECIDIEANQHGWAICWFKTKTGKTFKATAPGDVEQKRQTARMREHYIGQWATIEFANYTAEGIPFQPVATRWREDI